MMKQKYGIGSILVLFIILPIALSAESESTSTSEIKRVITRKKQTHEADWNTLIAQLTKHHDFLLDLPATQADAAALQARGLAQAMQWLQELKDLLLGNQDALILSRISDIETLIVFLQASVDRLTETVGNVTSESYNCDDLKTVQDIDLAQLNVIEWLKTIYRLLRDGECVS